MPLKRPRLRVIDLDRSSQSSKRLRSYRRLLVPFFCASLFILLALTLSCRHSTEESLKRAADAWDSGDYKQAAEEYERFLGRNPTGEDSLKARFQLANIYYFNLRHYDQARAQYQALLDQDPASQYA